MANLTAKEKKDMRKLESQLTYGRGIFTSDWERLTEYRRKHLIEQGKNPDDYDLTSRNLKRKGY